MIYLDSYIFLSFLLGEEKARKISEKILNEAKKEGCVISTTLLTEVIFHLSKRGFENLIDDFLLFIDAFEKMKIVEANKEIAIMAGRLRSKYYKKKECEISFLDCIHIATAIVEKCSKIVTGDRHFLKIKEIKVEVY